MSHLKEINKSYFQHLTLAIINSVKLIFASLILIIHAFIPCLFTSTTSDILKNILKSVPKNRKEILVRFNTKWREDPQGRQWRVLVGNDETLVHKIFINTNADTIERPVDGEQKFHFRINGNIEWSYTDDKVYATIY